MDYKDLNKIVLSLTLDNMNENEIHENLRDLMFVGKEQTLSIKAGEKIVAFSRTRPIDVAFLGAQWVHQNREAMTMICYESIFKFLCLAYPFISLQIGDWAKKDGSEQLKIMNHYIVGMLAYAQNNVDTVGILKDEIKYNLKDLIPSLMVPDPAATQCLETQYDHLETQYDHCEKNIFNDIFFGQYIVAHRLARHILEKVCPTKAGQRTKAFSLAYAELRSDPYLTINGQKVFIDFDMCMLNPKEKPTPFFSAAREMIEKDGKVEYSVQNIYRMVIAEIEIFLTSKGITLCQCEYCGRFFIWHSAVMYCQSGDCRGKKSRSAAKDVNLLDETGLRQALCRERENLQRLKNREKKKVLPEKMEEIEEKYSKPIAELHEAIKKFDNGERFQISHGELTDRLTHDPDGINKQILLSEGFDALCEPYD